MPEAHGDGAVGRNIDLLVVAFFPLSSSATSSLSRGWLV